MIKNAFIWILNRVFWMLAAGACAMVWIGGQQFVEVYNAYPSELTDGGIHEFAPTAAWEEYKQYKNRRSGTVSETHVNSSYYIEMRTQDGQYKYNEAVEESEAKKPLDNPELKKEKRIFLTTENPKRYYVGEVEESPKSYLSNMKFDSLKGIVIFFGGGLVLLGGLFIYHRRQTTTSAEE